MDRAIAEKLLKGGEKGIKEWNTRREQGEAVVNLEKIDLSGAMLYRAHLSGLQMPNANLTGANIIDSGLVDTNLRGADLSNAYLCRTDLTGADLAKARLRNAQLSICLDDANLAAADLAGADLSGARLTNADLTNANLSGANLMEANLERSNLSGVNLSQANLSCANLSGTKLHESIVADTATANHSTKKIKANLSRAHLAGANLTEADLSNANLTHADLSDTNLIKTHLTNTRLDFANLSGAKIWEAQRKGWSINHIICEYVYWDEEGKEKSFYPPGEFELLFGTTNTIVLHYDDGIKPIEITTLPMLVQQLQRKQNSKLRIRAIEETSAGSQVILAVEQTNNFEALKKELQTLPQLQRKLIPEKSEAQIYKMLHSQLMGGPQRTNKPKENSGKGYDARRSANDRAIKTNPQQKGTIRYFASNVVKEDQLYTLLAQIERKPVDNTFTQKYKDDLLGSIKQSIKYRVKALPKEIVKQLSDYGFWPLSN
ncbi:pentapeptide repeat-containing protein [Kaarinaea lacus]